MTKASSRTIALGMVLAGALAIAVVLNAQVAPNVPSVGPPSGKAPRTGEMAGGREPHPAVYHALRMLHRSKYILEKEAAHDFGGHRVQAIHDIDAAIQQLQQALKADAH